VARALRFVEALGRRPLWVPDGTGFLVNRLLMPVGLEACRAYSEHAATPWEIDQACMHAGMTIGPCATLDLVGLDVALAICRAFERARGDRFRPPALLERCVAAGRLGRKTGRGIFAYPHGRPEPDAALDALRGTLEAEQGIPRPTRFTVERLLLPLRSEARACVAEGLATAEQIDWALGATLGLQTGPFAAEAARQIPLVAAGGGAR
jgi:3-hydroxyacyl-CoA dehydrogenase